MYLAIYISGVVNLGAFRSTVSKVPLFLDFHNSISYYISLASFIFLNYVIYQESMYSANSSTLSIVTSN